MTQGGYRPMTRQIISFKPVKQQYVVGDGESCQSILTSLMYSLRYYSDL